ncbi:hypothetical protein K0B96_07785 [Horticoccus luteus]|uniref:DUF5672 domain-containing protein n=1 Tax=Horticoccus luteus TaxID=2862869 RepID=A0A8F9XHQ5_9BACT|nr:DUF5672 family protein [Horticoccus luteus]QYM80497.1 hypothetical protein K0B96_07785 [Horticoccus luteus]
MRKKAAVLVFAHSPVLTGFEKIALEQCCRVLAHHPIHLICPEGLDVSAYRQITPALQYDFIPPQWLASYRSYNRLKILPYLYRRYADFEYLLTYELDAFVFRDELLEWCAQGWDYIGAPWFDLNTSGVTTASPTGVGNSGFSLRRTDAMLRVLRSFGHVIPASTVVADWKRAGRISLGSFWLLFSRLTYRNNFFALLNDFEGNEDAFWGQFAARRFPWFRVAPCDVAKRFSFEVNAPRLHRELGCTLPFGCHKWTALTPEFWYPIIRSFGYNVREIDHTTIGNSGRS